MTKKRMRLAVAAGSAVLTMAASSVSALAVTEHNYNFGFPSYTQPGYSVDSNTRYKADGGRPYVTPSTIPYKTLFWLTADLESHGKATTAVGISSATKTYMSYTGSHGAGKYYALAGQSAGSTTHPAYGTSGKFAL